MGYQKNQVQTMKFEWDYAVDGGATGAIAFRQLHNKELESGMKVVGMKLIAETLVTSAGTPTLVIGNTTDADGYFADVYALVTTSAKGVVVPGEVAGALLWDDANDHFISYAPTAANDLDLNLTIGTAAATAGKLSLYIDFII